MSMVLLTTLLFGCAEKETETEQEDVAVVEDEGPVFKDLAEDGHSVDFLEPERYLGVWYEIATIPSGPQRNCTGTTAEYGLIDSETISVRNSCYLNDLDGTFNAINGTAIFIDDTFARLNVDFGFGFPAPYLVIEVDGSEGTEPYEFAVVSSVQTLWVLSRTPQMDDDLYQQLIDNVGERGYPVEDLEMTLQPILD